MLNHPSIHPRIAARKQLTGTTHRHSPTSFFFFVFLFPFLFSLFLQTFVVSRQSVTPEMFLSLFFPFRRLVRTYCITNTCALVYQSEINRRPGIQIRVNPQPQSHAPSWSLANKHTRPLRKLQNKRRFFFVSISFFFFFSSFQPAGHVCLMEALREYQHLPTAFQGGQQQPLLLSATTTTTAKTPTPHSPFFFIKSWQRWTCGSEDDDRRKRMNERKDRDRERREWGGKAKTTSGEIILVQCTEQNIEGMS